MMVSQGRDKNNEAMAERLRVKLGVDRKVLANLLGLEPDSYKQIELGYANLGRKKVAVLERLESDGCYKNTETETPAARDTATPGAHRPDHLEIAARLLADPASQGKIVQIAEIAGCDHATAARQLLEIEIKKQAKNR